MRNYIFDNVLMMNIGTLALSFTNIETALKIVMLVVSIVYTLMKIKNFKKD